MFYSTYTFLSQRKQKNHLQHPAGAAAHLVSLVQGPSCHGDDPAVTFWFPPVGGHFSPLDFGSRFHHPKKGHQQNWPGQNEDSSNSVAVMPQILSTTHAKIASWHPDMDTPPKFNIDLENDGWKTTFILGWQILRCFCKLPGSKCPDAKGKTGELLLAASAFLMFKLLVLPAISHWKNIKGW